MSAVERRAGIGVGLRESAAFGTDSASGEPRIGRVLGDDPRAQPQPAPGVVTVLPLAALPFVPEQSLDHYLTHVAYAVGQVPLVLVAVIALRRRHREVLR